MALGTPTEVASAVDAGVVTSVTTAAFTPTAGALLLAIAATTDAGAVTITDTVGDTGPWTDVLASTNATGGTAQCSAAWCAVGASPTSGTVTGAIGVASRWSLSVVQILGAYNADPIRQTATGGNQSSTLAVTLADDPHALNLLLAAIASRDLTPTVDAAFVEFVDRATAGSSRVLSVGHDLTPASRTHTWTTLTALYTNAGGLIEVQADTAAAAQRRIHSYSPAGRRSRF